MNFPRMSSGRKLKDTMKDYAKGKKPLVGLIKMYKEAGTATMLWHLWNDWLYDYGENTWIITSPPSATLLVMEERATEDMIGLTEGVEAERSDSDT